MSLGLEDVPRASVCTPVQRTTAVFPSFPFHGGYVEITDYALFTERGFSGSFSPLQPISDDMGRCF